MSAPHIILDRLPSLCQKLSELAEIWRSYDENNFACFFCFCWHYTTTWRTDSQDHCVIVHCLAQLSCGNSLLLWLKLLLEWRHPAT